MSADAPHPAAARTAAEIKRLRTALGLSTHALARLSGVSQPMLSHIENGRTVPSIRTLYTIADAMGVGPGALLGSPERCDGDARRQPVHAEDASPDGDAGQPVRTTLLHSSPDGAFEVYRIEQQAGHQDPWRFGHSGEDVMHVLEGRLTLGCGTTTYELAAGDTVRLTGSAPHWFDTPPSSGAVVLVATLRSAPAAGDNLSHS